MDKKSNCRKILVIILKHIGDVLVCSPVFCALKDAYPNSWLSVLVNEGTEEMVTLNENVDEVIVLDRNVSENIFRRVACHADFLLRLRRKKFDLCVELSAGDRGAFLGFVSGAGVRVGFQPKKRRLLGRRQLFTRLVDIRTTTQHMVDYNLALVRCLGIEPREKRLCIRWSESDHVNARRLLSEQGLREGEPYVVVHPTSRWFFKIWNCEGYAVVCDHIEEKYGIRVVVTSGPDNKELERVKKILTLTRRQPIDLSGSLSLKELAYCIDKSLLFIGVDSAPMHIAAAVDTPSVVLFGPSGDHMWGPWGNGHTVIKKGWPCQPCGRDGCDGTKISRCLEAISPAEVLNEVDKRLGAVLGSVSG